MRQHFFIVILIVALSLTGCNERTSDYALSPSFDLDMGSNQAIEVTGIEGKIAISYTKPFQADTPYDVLWLFWNNQNKIEGKKMEVMGFKKDSTLTSQILVVENLGGTHLGANAHHKTKMIIPEPGIWRLQVKIEGQDFWDIVLEVK